MKLKQRYSQALLTIVLLVLVFKIMKFTSQLKKTGDQSRADFPTLARTKGQTLIVTARTLRADEDTSCQPIKAKAITFSPNEDTSDQARVNLSDSDPILQPFLNITEIFLLIIVPSSSTHPKAFLERQAIRDTWGRNNENSSLRGSTLNDYEWKVIFLLGRTQPGNSTNEILRESMRHNDILQGTFNDGYFSVTQKIFMAFKWALLQTDFQFVLKADQDVYVHIPRLVKWLQKGDFPARLYGGVIRLGWQVPRMVSSTHPLSRRLYSRDIFPPFASGAFVLISRTVVEGMLKASKVCTPIRYDDPYLGILAEELKVGAFQIDEFHFRWAIRYSFGKVVKSYSDCQFIDVLTIGDNIDNQLKYYIHRRIRTIDAMSLNKGACGRSI